MRTTEHWTGGKPTAGSPTGTAPVRDPATGGRQAEVVLGSAADVDEAVRVAAAGWTDSLVGPSRIPGPDGVEFHTRSKVVTERRPAAVGPSAASYHFPTST
ncbi:hypothetical protein [Geodermatophilus sp. URMC 60]